MRQSYWQVNFAVALIVAAFICENVNARSKEQFAGIWHVEKPVFAARTVEGNEPPLKPEAARLYRAHMAARKQGDTSFDSATWCAGLGMPRLMFIDHPFQIMLDTPYVVFMHEWDRWVRVVYMEGALSENARAFALGFGKTGLPAGDIDGPMGLSRGRWEGDTLVIDTTLLTASTLIDGAGLPHGGALKLTERLTLRQDDVLENRIRIDDSEIFTRPWEMVTTYRRQHDAIIREDVCLDRIREGMPAVKE